MPTPDTTQIAQTNRKDEAPSSLGGGDRPKDQLGGPESFDLFKFYEDASEKVKTHIWSQTSWILSLSTAILALSANLYVQHRTVFGFRGIIWIAACVGAALCIYLHWTLKEFGRHIQRNWTHANVLAVRDHPSLIPFVRFDKDAKDSKKKKDFLHLRAIFRWIRHLFSEDDPQESLEAWKDKVLTPGYKEEFPPFCRRLQLAVWIVFGAHLVWAGIITWLASNQPAPPPTLPLGGPFYTPGTKFDGSWPF